MATTIALIGIQIGLSLLADALREEEKPEFEFDDTPTTLTTRGGFVPVVLGRRRIGYTFAWAGDRQVIPEVGAAPGKGKALGLTPPAPPPSQIYHEAGWHVLCVGPAEKLHGIFRDGTNLLPAPLTRTGTPSGTTVQVKGGSIQIFWGECDQPISTFLGDSTRVDVLSGWPHICYIIWTDLRLGTSPRWPTIEYEIEVRVDSSIPVMPADDFIDETVPGDEDDGVNPAWVLSQLLTGSYPHGVNIEPTKIDKVLLEAEGVRFVSEHLPVNIIASNGKSAQKVIADLLQDLGMTLAQSGSQLLPRSVRAEGTAPVLDDTMIMSRTPERTFRVGERLADRSVYIFKDRKSGYRRQDIQIDDDSQAFDFGRFKTRRLPIETITDFTTATKVADRRQQEDFVAEDVMKMEVARQGRLLSAGQLLNITGIGLVRVVSVEHLTESSRTVIEVMRDFYGIAPTAFFPAKPVFSGGGIAPLPDDPFDFIELPFEMTRVIGIGLARARAHLEIDGASIFGAPDATNFQFIGSQNQFAGPATLSGDLIAATDRILPVGPIVDTIDPFDFQNRVARDLSSDPHAWRQGEQLLFIGDEIFFVESILSLGGLKFQLLNLIRARMDTDQLSHLDGDRVWLINRGRLNVISNGIITPGVDLSVKTQPSANGVSVDLASVTEVTHEIEGRVLKPLPPGNWRANDQAGLAPLAPTQRRPLNQYQTGEDIILQWNYRVRDGAGQAAGEVLAGDPIQAGQPSHEGEFIIEIIDPAGPTVVDTLIVDDDSGLQVYLNADLIAAFSGEPDTFTATIRNRLGAFESATRSITVTKVVVIP